MRRSFIGFDVSPDKAFAFHNCSAYLPVFLYQMHAHRVPCTGLDVVGYKLKTVEFWLLFCLPILLMTLHRTHRQGKFPAGTTEGQILFKRLTSFKSLCGELIVLVGFKDSMTNQTTGTTTLPAWYHGEGRQEK